MPKSCRRQSTEPREGSIERRQRTAALQDLAEAIRSFSHDSVLDCGCALPSCLGRLCSGFAIFSDSRFQKGISPPPKRALPPPGGVEHLGGVPRLKSFPPILLLFLLLLALISSPTDSVSQSSSRLQPD